MFIESVKLINIRSYAEQEICFRSGVNFISGRNGAGKTTIIEAIGWALFGAAPAGTIEENLRYGTKKGSITVHFHIDCERYSVVKMIGTASSRRLYDASGSEIDLHGDKDMNDFLKELLHVSPDEDISALFNDVIGVRQGSFTQPFIEAPGDRKRIFNKVLRLDSYAKAERNSAELKRLAESKIAELDKEVALLAQTAEDEEPVRLSIAEVDEFIWMNLNAVAKYKEEQVLAQVQVDKHKAEKDACIKNSNAAALAQVQLRSAQTAASSKEVERNSAKEAKESLVDLFEPYNAYLSAKEQDTRLNDQRMERDRLLSQKAELDTAITTEFHAIEIEHNNNNERIRKNLNLQSRTEEGLAQLKIHQAEWSGKEKNLQEKKAELDHELKKISESEAAQKNFSKLKENLTLGLGKFEAIENSITEIQTQLQKEIKTKSDLEILLEAEKEEQAASKSSVALQQKLETLIKDHERFKSGRCPYTDVPCNTVGTLENDTIEKIELIRQQIHLLNEKENTAKILQRQYNDARQRHLKLEEAKSKLPALIENREGCIAGFGVLFQLIRKIDLKEPTYQELCNAIQSDSVSYEQLKKIESLMELANGEIERAILSARSMQENRVREWTEQNTQLNADVKRTEEEKNRLSKELEAALGELELSESVQNQLEKRKEALASKQDERAAIARVLEQYVHLEADMEAVRLIKAENESAYEHYVFQNTVAQKLPAIEADLSELENAVLMAAADDRLKQAALEQSEKDYDPNAEQIAVDRLSSSRDQFVEARERLKGLEQNKTNLLQTFERITQAKTKKLEKAEELAALQKTQELLRLCLKVLRDAGERMAQVYRERLSIEADRYYRAMSADASTLQWTDDYDIRLLDTHDSRERRRVFRQLSGGEQMTVALALRLALLTQLSSMGIAFFDEPTTNLDVERRSLLADVLPVVTKGFDQIFVVSHDDTFDSITENIIPLRRGSNGTELDTRI